ncbi:MAG: hypothetical protein JWO31_1419, partial [Phycisphaerales bacterium]|nr:hypothetical protein [Phycisphaerales bacterium]
AAALLPLLLAAPLRAADAGPVNGSRATGPVKVFVLAGQSNMEGQGFVAADPGRNGGKGSLELLAKDAATADRFRVLVDAAGTWRTRDDVFISYLGRKGPLTVGYGVSPDRVGPELGFGWAAGDALEEPVLLVKCAWGGKSLAVDFRPPSSGKVPYPLSPKAQAALDADPAIVGKYYRETIRLTRAAVAGVKDLVPGSDGRCELAGVGWHQGWNDRVDDQFNAEYERNLANLIRDVRKDLAAPNLPFVVAETGMNGPDEKHPRALSLMKAQAAVAGYPEFKGNVAFVKTQGFWRPADRSPLDQGYHWNANAETYWLIGRAMGEAMVPMVKASVPPPAAPADEGRPVRPAEMAGYLLVPNEKVPPSFNGGFSMYVAAWPLLGEYPGHRFQTGLFGTWMHAQYEGPAPAKLYSDVEGGLGWWRDTRFPTTTPKFIMGGVAPNFGEIANGPAHGAGDWDHPRGLYGVAQLSPWLLFPLDGLNLKQGTRGEWFGYGYLPLPLTPAKAATAGKDVPTGGNCWTLFLNVQNFKGPVAFFIPYFWSHAAVARPDWAGQLLDSRPSEPNRPLQMETQYVPAAQAADAKGQVYARVAPTSFPRGPGGESAVVHRVTSYDRRALWDPVRAWFEGGPPAGGAVDPAGAAPHRFGGRGGATWQIYPPSTPKEKRARVAWTSFATPVALDETTFGYRWDGNLTRKDDSPGGPLETLPEYYRLDAGGGNKAEWVPVRADAVPAETGLAQVRFDRPEEKRPEPYVTPEDPKSCWKRPGPAAGPFRAHLGDGSVVTYAWYRFADQPALLNADLTDAERERMQERVEKLHRHWTKDREYLAPPTRGTLAEVDPALVVTPPPGLEVGYVPIATRQAAGP